MQNYNKIWLVLIIMNTSILIDIYSDYQLGIKVGENIDNIDRIEARLDSQAASGKGKPTEDGGEP